MDRKEYLRKKFGLPKEDISTFVYDPKAYNFTIGFVKKRPGELVKQCEKCSEWMNIQQEYCGWCLHKEFPELMQYDEEGTE